MVKTTERRAIEAAKGAARGQGIRIYCVGVGLPNQGTPIPLRQSNGELRGYKHDRNGKPIVTKLEDALLREIAQLTNGNYYQATPGEAEMDRLFAELAAIEKRKIEERQFTRYEDRFQYFLGVRSFIFGVGVFAVRVPRQ